MNYLLALYLVSVPLAFAGGWRLRVESSWYGRVTLGDLAALLAASIAPGINTIFAAYAGINYVSSWAIWEKVIWRERR